MKRASKIQSLWLVMQSVFVTIYFSVRCIYQCYRKRPLVEINHTIRGWAKNILGVIHLSYRVYNPHGIAPKPHKAWIIMSNHASLYDIPLIFMAVPGNIRMVAKKELFRVPLWGHAMRAAKFISIDRKNSAQAALDLKLAQQQMEEDGVVPWISPEGTRSHNGQLGPFKAGGFLLALSTNAMIIPVGIRGAGDILPPKTLRFCLNASAEVHIGEPIDTSEYSIATRKVLIQRVKDEIAQLAGISTPQAVEAQNIPPSSADPIS